MPSILETLTFLKGFIFLIGKKNNTMHDFAYYIGDERTYNDASGEKYIWFYDELR